MKFGVFDHMDSSGRPLAELFEDRLRLAEAYDRMGLYALHVDFDGIVRSEQAIAGSPRTVRNAIARQAAQSGANYLLARFAFGDLALEESLNSADLFARRVMPELSAAPVS